MLKLKRTKIKLKRTRIDNEDLTGQTFGKFYVIEKSNRKRKDTSWMCKCSCGKVSDVLGYNLKSGNSSQCRACGNRQRGERSGLDVKLLDWSRIARKCPSCKKVKLLKYWKMTHSKYGRIYAEQCKKCRKMQDHLNRVRFPQDYRKKEANRHERSRIYRRFGLDMKVYMKMLKDQQKVCAICGGVNPSGRSLYIDHCHSTGKIRGLLCGCCNSLLGFAKDRVSILRKAASYLLAFSKRLKAESLIPS